jgi:WD40 repeat protein
MADSLIGGGRDLGSFNKAVLAPLRVAKYRAWLLSSCLLAMLGACAPSPTVIASSPTIASTREPTIVAATPVVGTDEPDPIPPAFPLDPLPASPRISPENAWSLRSIGIIPGRIYFSPNMRHLQWITEERIKIIDSADHTSIATLPSESLASFSPDGNVIAWAPGDGRVHVRDLKMEAEELIFEGFSPECCLQITLSPDELMMLVIDRDPDSDSGYGQVLRLIDLQNGQESLSLEVGDWAGFSPDGRMIGIQESRMIGATLWDIVQSEKLVTISGFSTAAPIYGVRFAPDWESVAFWARSGGDLYDVSTGEKRFDFIGEPISFNPSGGVLATSETGWMSSECTGAVCLYDLELGGIRDILPHGNVVWDLEFAPGGRLLATDDDSRIRLWDVEHASEVTNIPVELGNVWSVDFSPDGSYLLAYAHAEEDDSQVVQLWAVDPTASESRVQFDPGATIWSTEAPTHRGETQRLVLFALEGQTMQVFVGGEGTDLSIQGEDGTVLKSTENAKSFWRGELPMSQDYFIDLRTIDRDWVDPAISLSIAIAPPGQESQSLVYDDPDGKFKLEYSDYFAIDPAPGLDPILKGEELLRLAFVGTEYYEGSTLQDAFVVIAASDDPDIVSDCTASMGAYEQDQGRVNINGQDHFRWGATDGGMGQFYVQTAFRSEHSGTCYEFVLFENVLSAAHFAPEIIYEEHDQAGLLDKVLEVLHTLEFSA